MHSLSYYIIIIHKYIDVQFICVITGNLVMAWLYYIVARLMVFPPSDSTMSDSRGNFLITNATLWAEGSRPGK